MPIFRGGDTGGGGGRWLEPPHFKGSGPEPHTFESKTEQAWQSSSVLLYASIIFQNAVDMFLMRFELKTFHVSTIGAKHTYLER